MPTAPLPPDPESVEKWRNMPQNKPSPHALPPMTGGLRANRGLVFGFGLVLLVLFVISYFGR